MANGISDAAIANVLNHMFATGTYSKPTGHKLRLYKGAINESNLATNHVSDTVDDTAYAPQTVTFADEGGTTNNRVYINATVTFPAVIYGSGAAAYVVTHAAIVDGSNNILAYGTLPTAITRTVGEPLAFNSGALYIELART